jgi:hypothetical protein
MAEIIGTIICPFCLCEGRVKKNRNGRLYYHDPDCGPVNIHGDGFQDWIEDHMTPINKPQPDPVDTGEGDGLPPIDDIADPEPEPVRTEQAEDPEPEPVRTPEPEESAAGLLL